MDVAALDVEAGMNVMQHTRCWPAALSGRRLFAPQSFIQPEAETLLDTAQTHTGGSEAQAGHRNSHTRCPSTRPTSGLHGEQGTMQVGVAEGREAPRGLSPRDRLGLEPGSHRGSSVLGWSSPSVKSGFRVDPQPPCPAFLPGRFSAQF